MASLTSKLTQNLPSDPKTWLAIVMVDSGRVRLIKRSEIQFVEYEPQTRAYRYRLMSGGIILVHAFYPVLTESIDALTTPVPPEPTMSELASLLVVADIDDYVHYVPVESVISVLGGLENGRCKITTQYETFKSTEPAADIAARLDRLRARTPCPASPSV